MQQAGWQEGLVFTGADLRAHQLRAGCQDTRILLVEVDAGHGRHVVDVVIVSEEGKRDVQNCSSIVLNCCKLTNFGKRSCSCFDNLKNFLLILFYFKRFHLSKFKI